MYGALAPAAASNARRRQVRVLRLCIKRARIRSFCKYYVCTFTSSISLCKSLLSASHAGRRKTQQPQALSRSLSETVHAFVATMASIAQFCSNFSIFPGLKNAKVRPKGAGLRRCWLCVTSRRVCCASARARDRCCCFLHCSCCWRRFCGSHRRCHCDHDVACNPPTRLLRTTAGRYAAARGGGRRRRCRGRAAAQGPRRRRPFKARAHGEHRGALFGRRTRRCGEMGQRCC